MKKIFIFVFIIGCLCGCTTSTLEKEYQDTQEWGYLCRKRNS